MKFINIKHILTVGFLVFSLNSCEFADTNVDPTNPSPAQVTNGLILPAAQFQSAYNIGALGGRMPGIVIQHFDGFDAQQVAFSDYVIDESSLNNLWGEGLYAGSMKDLDIIISNAEEEGNNFYLGVAKIMMAQNLGLATTFWGDIPFSEAFEGVDILTPTYDTQESIYADIQRLLNEGIAALTSDDATSLEPREGDLIYAGDISLWIKTARSLQARYLLQLTKRSASNAQRALDALNAGDGAISSNEEIPYVFFESAATAANPYAQFGTQRPKTMIVNNNFVTMMNGDPRQSVYMVQDGDQYLFFEETSPEDTDLFWSTNSSPIPLISYTEVKFIEAEAIERTGGDGSTALQEAIEASFDQLDVSAGAYVGAVIGAYNGAATFEEKLEILITEKYKALYCQAEPELWVDFRRTGYPNLTPSPNGENGVNPSGIVPRRFLYPIDERQFNNANRLEAIDRQGGHLLDDNMWAFE